MFCLSRNLYEAASDRCSGSMSGRPARSAIVRASFIIREQARADRSILSIILSSRERHSGEREQNFSICRLFMAALQKMPSPANLSVCIFLALETRAAISALDSDSFRFISLRASILETINCMSMRSMMGPESLEM